MEDNALNPNHLVTPESLRRSLGDAVTFDDALADWAIEVVSNTAKLIANRSTWTQETVPPAVESVISFTSYHRLQAPPL